MKPEERRYPDQKRQVTTGYLSREYGRSFEELGEVVQLPESGLQLLKRAVDQDTYDLVGQYPYAMCQDWSKLSQDRDFLRETGAVSVVFVADPFESGDVERLFADWDVCRHFKTHFVVDLSQDWRRERPKEMRRFCRRGLELQNVKSIEPDPAHAAELWALYQNSIARHDIQGIQRLSPKILEKQLAVEGLVLVVAEDNVGMTGAMMAFRHGETANAHLEFLSSRAHHLKTSYALLHKTLEELEKRECHLVNLGGPAGLDDDPEDGLARFKRRWANAERPAMICGLVLNPSKYQELSSAAKSPDSAFFPAYRLPDSPYAWRPFQQ